LDKHNLSPAAFIGVQGDDEISFSSSQPDFPPPKEVYKILPHYSDFKFGRGLAIIENYLRTKKGA